MKNILRTFFLSRLSYCLLFLSIIFYTGCKKQSNDFEILKENSFFGSSNAAPEIIKKIALKIQNQNKQEQFLDQIIENEGFAIWDKSEIIKYADNDSLILIPLVLKNTNYVNSYILYRRKANSVSMDIIRGRKYASYNFNEGFSGNQVISDLMLLNKKVFGHDIFLISDNQLFGLNKIIDLTTPFYVVFTPNCKTDIVTLNASNYKSKKVSLQPNQTNVFSSTNPNTAIQPIAIIPCNRILTINGYQGVTKDTGPLECKNVTVNYTPVGSGATCEYPPIGPAGGGQGGSTPGQTGGTGNLGGGSPNGLPGLVILMPPCPVGMSQKKCDEMKIPVIAYLNSMPWKYTGDNGELFVDAYPKIEPNFQFDPKDEYEKKYLRFTDIVKKLKTFVKGNPKVLAALQKYSGFTKTKILEQLTFGKGPVIKIEEMNGVFGYYNKNKGSNVLHIRASYVRGLEQAFLESTRSATAFLLAVTILHESVHLSRNENNLSDKYEFGIGFERDAFEVVTDELNAYEVSIKFNPF